MVSFLAVTEKPPVLKCKLCLIITHGAKFRLIWHSLSKPGMSLSSALLSYTFHNHHLLEILKTGRLS